MAMLFFQGLLLLACSGVVSDGAQQYANLGVVRDFVRDFSPGMAPNGQVARVSQGESVGGVARASILLRPGTAAGAGALAYSGVAVPAANTPAFLFFATSVRKSVPQAGVEQSAEGVRLTVYVDGEQVFSEESVASVWMTHAAEMSRWAGKTVKVVFSAASIGEGENNAWSVWGDPLLLSLTPASSALTGEAAGIAFVRTDLAAPDTVGLRMGEQYDTFALPAGTHWLPLEFDSLRRFSFSSVFGRAEVKTVWIGARGPGTPPTRTSVKSVSGENGRPVSMREP